MYNIPKTIEFTKMHGLGNNYIYIDNDAYPIDDPEAFARRWSDPHKGIGGDGLVLFERAEIINGDQAYRMRIFNADGSEAMMCGNAIRCVGKILYESRKVLSEEVDIVTLSGVKHLTLLEIEGNEVHAARVDMNAPVLTPEVSEITLPSEHKLQGVNVSMGNPHWVLFAEEDVDDYPLANIGPVVEFHAAFPDRTNFEIVNVTGPNALKMRVWERGSGLTQACGTGACASAVAAIHKGLVSSPVVVTMPGGALTIEWDGDTRHPVYMTGEAVLIYHGTLSL